MQKNEERLHQLSWNISAGNDWQQKNWLRKTWIRTNLSVVIKLQNTFPRTSGCQHKSHEDEMYWLFIIYLFFLKKTHLFLTIFHQKPFTFFKNISKVRRRKRLQLFIIIYFGLRWHAQFVVSIVFINFQTDLPLNLANIHHTFGHCPNSDVE